MEPKQKIRSFTDLEAWKKAHALACPVVSSGCTTGVVGYVTLLEHKEIESRLITVHKLIGGLSKYVRALALFLILSTIYCIPYTASASLTQGLVGNSTFDGKDTNWGTSMVSYNQGSV